MTSGPGRGALLSFRSISYAHFGPRPIDYWSFGRLRNPANSLKNGVWGWGGAEYHEIADTRQGETGFREVPSGDISSKIGGVCAIQRAFTYMLLIMQSRLKRNQ